MDIMSVHSWRGVIPQTYMHSYNGVSIVGFLLLAILQREGTNREAMGGRIWEIYCALWHPT